MMQYNHHYQLQTGMTYKLLICLFTTDQSKTQNAKQANDDPQHSQPKKKPKWTIPSILQKLKRQQTVKHIQ